MEKKEITLAFVVVSMVVAVAFVGFAIICDGESDADPSTGYIAKIDNAYYTTLIDAVKAVTDGQTIEILCNVNDGSGLGVFYATDHPLVYELASGSYTKTPMKLSIGESFTIDFNNHTYCVAAHPVGSTGTEN